MKYYRDKIDPRKTLIFIMIGAILVVFTDLVILDGKKFIWWDKYVPENMQIIAGQDEDINITALQTQHDFYMENGIRIPDVTADNILPTPIESVQANNTTIQRNAMTNAINLASIEPALGQKNIEEHSHKPLYDIPHNPAFKDITTKTHIDDVISDLKKAPDVEDHYSSPEAKEPIQDISSLPEQLKPQTTKDTIAYQKPAVRGKIAIIIDDMGLSLRSKQMEVLTGPLTLSYLPYAKDLPTRTKRARSHGHELMVHIPMEAVNKNIDAGPRVLKDTQSKATLLKSLDWALSQFDGYVGINNHMGSRMTQNKNAMSFIMDDLKKRDLFFVDSRTISSSVAAQTAKETGIAYAERDVFLDHEISAAFIERALKKLEQKAKVQGYAIGIGHPHKETIAALKSWIPTLKEKGLELVPVSVLVTRPKSAGEAKEYISQR